MTLTPQTTLFDQGGAFLSEKGLNLYAVLDIAGLPHKTLTALGQAGIDYQHYARLLLLGNGGGTLWSLLGPDDMARQNPIDQYTLDVVNQFSAVHLNSGISLLVYPGDYLIPLQQLGTLAGWHHVSPLGIGINPEYGLWFAYRAALLTTVELPPTVVKDGQNAGENNSPCTTCIEKPCISSCQGNAASAERSFSIPSCTSFRLQNDSPCATQCLARIACPVGAQHRYSNDQMHYHYLRSLQSIRMFQNQNQNQTLNAKKT